MNGLALLLFVGGVGVALYFHPHARSARRYEADLFSREPIGDRELFRRYFAPGEVADDVPGRVRRVFAKHMSYSADRMQPNDDLTFFWAELDLVDLVRDLDREFGIKIAAADVATLTACTIRAFVMLVSGRIRPQSDVAPNQ
jgi:hypothetical protein